MRGKTISQRDEKGTKSFGRKQLVFRIKVPDVH